MVRNRRVCGARPGATWGGTSPSRSSKAHINCKLRPQASLDLHASSLASPFTLSSLRTGPELQHSGRSFTHLPWPRLRALERGARLPPQPSAPFACSARWRRHAMTMKSHLPDRLLRREQGDTSRYSKIRGIYGDKKWIDDMDIVNELTGHSGCVNALSWSRSGGLLASGSDDTFVNLYSYHPESSTSQFALATTISTGHTQNIFSVKFMPHSNDNTIVTAAGDHEVRIFDLEYSGRPIATSSASSLASARRTLGRSTEYNGTRYLSDGDTNAKVFRSHTDRVKRIVTESSPYLFLTCSEDGEVRQWDTRMPESHYPEFGGSYFRGPASRDEDRRPPPLISYKDYSIDLNTISCSPSQPYYIALGGSHLHCFLHDRRMIGRDQLRERGTRMRASNTPSETDENLIGRSTQCVRKFAPNGQQVMGRRGNHITACKISDADPNDIVVSWSAESIYSFDINRSPDADDMPDRVSCRPHTKKSSLAKNSSHRRRKRKRDKGSASGEGEDRGGSRARTESQTRRGEDSELALMVQYGNGQSEEIPIEPTTGARNLEEAREALLPEQQRRSQRIAKKSVQLRKALFSEKDFAKSLDLASEILPEIDNLISHWRYPTTTNTNEIACQREQRLRRSSIRRFVQAAGTVARILKGPTSDQPSSTMFTRIEPGPSAPGMSSRNQFLYDFIKAILLWLDSGIGALVEGFTRPSSSRDGNAFHPIGQNAGSEAIDDSLIPYLMRHAGTTPVPNVDASRFEVDENQAVFESERAAVKAFGNAIQIPFADLSSAAVAYAEDSSDVSMEQTDPASSRPTSQDRNAATRFWAFRVARGLLLTVGEGLTYSAIDDAFGGSGVPDPATRVMEEELGLAQQDIDTEEPEQLVEDIEVVRRKRRNVTAGGPRASVEERSSLLSAHENGDGEEDGEGLMDLDDDTSDDEHDDDIDADEDGDEAAEDGEEESSSSDSDSRFFMTNPLNRHQREAKVEMNVPCAPHTREYRGHCNAKTVKDVNYFGLQDEYVVSGSDDGNFFAWNRHTAELVGIWEGDGEVVNVIQGHPYEPMLAVSGIDHTVKIFSPDARARHCARNAIGVSAADTSEFSSIEWPRRARRGRRTSTLGRSTSDATNNHEESSRARAVQADELAVSDSEDESKVAPEGLPSKKRIQNEYEITSQNDDQRRGAGLPYIPRSVLAHLAAHIRHAQGMGPDDDDDGNGDGGTGPHTIQLSDDCSVM
ncbi:hypothetical protein BDY21DRAFT_331920 [Lineolata rhizophorae]|uniref:WD40-repeat-containing domain protein n=1 Tax=Lineolata rhizophorae TaxID=578093 RepID=A0A6A6PBZ3_9PEZI|nr:hypothetical protein BDY21DRAFT_331920 [Lineolata rhizophorae]